MLMEFEPMHDDSFDWSQWKKRQSTPKPRGQKIENQKLILKKANRVSHQCDRGSLVDLSTTRRTHPCARGEGNQRVSGSPRCQCHPNPETPLHTLTSVTRTGPLGQGFITCAVVSALTSRVTIDCHSGSPAMTPAAPLYNWTTADEILAMHEQHIPYQVITKKFDITIGRAHRMVETGKRRREVRTGCLERVRLAKNQIDQSWCIPVDCLIPTIGAVVTVQAGCELSTLIAALRQRE